jgi:hypothetical protein
MILEKFEYIEHYWTETRIYLNRKIPNKIWSFVVGFVMAKSGLSFVSSVSSSFSQNYQYQDCCLYIYTGIIMNKFIIAYNKQSKIYMSVVCRLCMNVCMLHAYIYVSYVLT